MNLSGTSVTEEQWLFMQDRISAVEALALAIAKSSPQSGQIKAQLVACANSRRKALEITPMAEDRIEAAMEPFLWLISELER